MLNFLKKKKQKKKLKVAIGISGGVDSAVTAALLKEKGYEVVGVHLYCYDEGPYCTAQEDRTSAVRVADHLGIPLKVWDLRKQYKDKVIRYFFSEYKAGRTPNPDVMCNREIKFGLFLEKALKELKVDYVATGHYAQIKKGKEGYQLLQGVDKSKDQSYFLYTLGQKQLGHILFPIGDLTKKQVREEAKKLNLPNKSRPDSQGICFVGPINVSRFLRENIPPKKGPVVTSEGQVIGEHDGIWFFTEGQRHGFRVFKPGLPLYVISKDVKTNTLVVERGPQSQINKFSVENLSYINLHYKTRILEGGIKVRIRHLGDLLPATAKKEKNQILVKLVKPISGVAPGQSAVFYQGQEVLGGGVIFKTT